MFSLRRDYEGKALDGTHHYRRLRKDSKHLTEDWRIFFPRFPESARPTLVWAF